MKHDKGLWKIFCLITTFCVFFAAMAEARPNLFFFHVKPPVGKSRYMLTELMRRPDLEVFWKLSRCVSGPHFSLSELQKRQIYEEFRRLFVKTIAAEQEAFSKELGDSVAARQFGQILAEHRKAIHDIFTPEQHRKHRSSENTGKLIGKIQTAAEFPRSVLSGLKLAKMYSHAGGVFSGIIPQCSRTYLTQTSSSELFERDVYQLQILRL